MNFYSLLLGLQPGENDRFTDSSGTVWLYKGGDLIIDLGKKQVLVDEEILKYVKPPTGFCKVVFEKSKK